MYFIGMNAKLPEQLSANNAVVCLSGGMDSTSLLLRLLREKRNVFGISFDYGQKHRLELERLEANLKYLADQGHSVHWKLLDVSGLKTLLHSSLTDPNWDVPKGHYEQDNMKETVVPNRNAIFASIAYAHALSIATKEKVNVDLCLGVHSGDHAIYPDCRPEFYEAIFQAFTIGNWDSERVSLYLPYLHDDKHKILQDAQHSVEQLQLNFETVFSNTCTSYSPDADGKSHGLTGSDVERILAFHKLGIPDPIDYRLPWEQVVEEALKLEKEIANQ